MKTLALTLLASAAVLAGCAAAPPATSDFPAGARAPAAAELTTLLRGKSYNMTGARGDTIRSDHAATANELTIFFRGRSDSGTWRAEDGRVGYQVKVVPSVCNDVRVAGTDIYLKRNSGEVVRLVPR